jgi:hypothetical protein
MPSESVRRSVFGVCDESGLIILFPSYPERYMTTVPQDMKTAIPDLKNIPLDQLAELGSSPLAHSIALYRERLMKNGVPLSSFNARI